MQTSKCGLRFFQITKGNHRKYRHADIVIKRGRNVCTRMMDLRKASPNLQKNFKMNQSFPSGVNRPV